MRKRNGYLSFWMAGAAVCLFLGGCSEAEDRKETLKTQGTLQKLVAAVCPEEPVFQNEEEQFDYYWKKRQQLPEQFARSYQAFVTDTSAVILTEAWKKESNVIYSPLSLYASLALAAEGAAGETKAQLLDVLHYETTDLLRADGKAALESLSQMPREENNHPNEWGEYPQESRSALRIANSLWVQKDLSLKEAFLDSIRNFSYAEVYQADLHTEQTAQAMADWVKEQTGGVLAPAAVPLGEEILLSLRNTVYFYDEWMDRFDPERTKEDRFTCTDGTEVSCAFLNRTMGSHGFRRGSNYTESSLSLKNGEMTFYLPEEGVPLEDLIQTPETLRALLTGEGEWCSGEVVWKIPKFSYGASLKLEESLKELGLESVVSEHADFSAMTDQASLVLSSVTQDAHIGIDENGVEAAAFTEITWAGAAMPTDRAEMILDRPFLYTIKKNGQILFIGICENPAEE